jgi:uncharacterized membrane protein (DUF2068 family)
MPTDPKTDAQVQPDGSVAPALKKRAPTLYAIIWFKIIKGVLCVMLAGIIYAEGTMNRDQEYKDFMSSHAVKFIFDHLRIHPENKFFTRVADGIAGLTTAKVHRAAWAALIWSLFPLTEGIGMYYRVGWAGWLAIVESAFFIPIEFYELANPKTFSLFIVGVTVINIIIVCYLFALRDQLFHHHQPRPRLPA